MKIRKAFKFRLKPNREDSNKLSRYSGSVRFVWNKAQALIKDRLEAKEKYPGYVDLANLLPLWKQEESTVWLKEVPAQPLQQVLKDLDKAWKDAFKKVKMPPRFKKKGTGDSFRYPQGVKVKDSKVYLPKIGWVRFRKSREIEGLIKNTTISQKAGHWYVSFQVELEVKEPFHPSKSAVGVDLGVSNFAFLSNGEQIAPLNSFKTLQTKLAKQQRRLAGKKKFSANWKKQKAKITRLHVKIADCRQDFLHQVSTQISKNHAMIVVEDLKVKNMSSSAKGTLESPGKNVEAKKGLNRSILDQGWFEFRRQLEYKQLWNGGLLVAVDPRNTSRKCSVCGHVSKDNRKSQAKFECKKCSHVDHADHNAALNILEAGLSSFACGNISSVAMFKPKNPLPLGRGEVNFLYQPRGLGIESASGKNQTFWG